MQYEVAKPIIESVKGATFAGIDTLTEVKLLGGKKNPMQGRVQKMVTGSSVMLFSNVKDNAYLKMVHRRMEKEDKDPSTFELSERKWGLRIGNTPFIEHKDKKYIEVFFVNTGVVQYLLDGNPIEKDQIEGLQEKTENENSQGGIDDKVIIRAYALDSIKNMRVMGSQIT